VFGPMRQTTIRFVSGNFSGHRVLVEKALQMRVERYLADVKAQLLTKTIFEVDDQRKLLKGTHEKLAESMSALEGKKAELSMEVAWRKALFNSESVGVVVIDGAGLVLEVNRRFCEMTGCDRRQAVGWSLERLFVDGGAYRQFIERLFDSDGQGVGETGREFPLRCRDGSLLWCEISANAIDPRDRSQGAVCAFVDIGKYKETREQAESENRAMSTFLANMSHELRTPLNAILGYSRLLVRDSSADSRTREGLSVIEQSGRHLLALIEDVLDLAKVEARKLEICPRSLHLPSFLEGVLGIVRIHAREKGLVLESRIDIGPLVSIEADERRLRQILLNLLNNAVKFTDEGRVVLRVTSSTSIHPEGPCRLCFEVEDTGCGVSPEDTQRIFHPFEQAGAKDYREGTGLGLAIARQLVQQMGGDIGLESVVGRGSCFRFQLSFPSVLESGRPRRAQQLVPSGYYGPRRRVLVVDSSEANRFVLKEALEGAGFSVSTAAGGAEALRSLSSQLHHLVLMELAMSDMDGYRTLELMRRDASCNEVQVVAVSAGDTEEQLTQILEAGFFAYIGKPLDMDELFGQLRDLLGLEWMYGGRRIPAESDQERIKAPPLEELNPLEELLALGKMGQIVQWSESLAPEYRAFGRRAAGLARELDEVSLQTLLNQAKKGC